MNDKNNDTHLALHCVQWYERGETQYDKDYLMTGKDFINKRDAESVAKMSMGKLGKKGEVIKRLVRKNDHRICLESGLYKNPREWAEENNMTELYDRHTIKVG